MPNLPTSCGPRSLGVDSLPAPKFVAADTSAVNDLRVKLMEYNQRAARPYDFAPLCLMQLDANGQLIGGVIGASGWNWLQVDSLFVDEQYRYRGIAKRLMQEAETQAKLRGCVGAYLDTFDFQARGFYEKIGYEVFGTINDQPPGHARYWMRKAL